MIYTDAKIGWGEHENNAIVVSHQRFAEMLVVFLAIFSFCSEIYNFQAWSFHADNVLAVC